MPLVPVGLLTLLLILLVAPSPTRAQILATLSGHEKTVTSVSYSPDSELIASGSWDHTVRIWDAATYQPVATLEGHTGAVTSVTYSPDGNTIISGSRDQTIVIWDAHTHQTIATISGHAGSITDLAYSPDGSTIISASEDQTVKLWDATTHEPLATLTGHAGIVYSVAYSPNGKLIISGGWDGVINIWNAKTYKLKKALGGQMNVVYSVSFTPDNHTIIGGRGDGTINIWNARNYQLIQTLRGNAGTVTSVSSHPDGEFIMSGHGDGSINIWNTSTYKLSKTLNGHAGTVTSVSYSPDGEVVVSGSGDYLVNIWDFFPMVANLRSPPDLYAEISFSEPDHNGYLDADEVGNLHLQLDNKGTGDALNLKLIMTLAEANPDLQFESRSLRHLKSGATRSYDIPLTAGLDIKTQPNALRIEVTEQQGHHMDPLEFAFTTQSLKTPRFVLLGVDIDDDDQAASFGNSDGMVQPGEQIEATVRIQNQGSRENPGDAHDVEIDLTNQSDFIELHSENTFYKKRLKLGEVFEFDVVFAVIKAYPRGDPPTDPLNGPLLPITLDIHEKYGIADVSDLSLNIELNEKPSSNPPLIITPKPARLGRAKFDRLGSKTTVVFKERKPPEDLTDVPSTRLRRQNALAVIIGMPDAENATADATLMKTYFENVLGIPPTNIKLYTNGLTRNDLVTLFEQKLSNIIDQDTELYLFYSGAGIVDTANRGYLLPHDGSRTPELAAKTCYSLTDLSAALNALNTRSKTVILNIHLPTEVKDNPFLAPISSPDGSADLTVVTCVTNSRTNPSLQDTDHGPFTHFLASALKGHADTDHDGSISLREIQEYVHRNLATANSTILPPTFWTSDGNYDRTFSHVTPR